MNTTTLPIAPDLFWALATLLGVVLLSGLIFGFLYKPDPQNPPPLERLQQALGLAALHPALFFLALLIWLLVFISLTLGILWLIWSVIYVAIPASQSTTWDFRFSLAKLTALTAVLGAVVALPFTVIRLRLTREQVDIAQAALFNDKINAAAADLSARRQVTRAVQDRDGTETILTEWQDDLVTRAAAIDRLEGLAHERPDETPRIARMLSVYVRELSREYPAQEHPRHEWQRLIDPRDDSEPMSESDALYRLGLSPDDVTIDALKTWARGLKPIRSDMEKAAQTLGRLKRVAGIPPEDIPIDLRGANLQGFDLSGLDFSRAWLHRASLEGTTCDGSVFCEALLVGAKFCGGNLIGVNLQGAHLSNANLEGTQMQAANLASSQTQAGGANFHGADLSNADLEDAECFGADFSRAIFRDARLVGCNLRRTNLREAQFQRTKLEDAVLLGSNIDGAWFFDMELNARQIEKARTALGMALRDTTVHLPQDSLRFWDNAFGDATSKVIVDGIETHPAHWPNEILNRNDFVTQWRAFQQSIGYTPPD